jgi:hypothetical protein
MKSVFTSVPPCVFPENLVGRGSARKNGIVVEIGCGGTGGVWYLYS